jgi:MFS transporter, ACS family, tartrate transporter
MTEQSTSPAQRARRRIAWRLLPFLCLLYVVAYVDRVNVGYAALAMTQDLGFDAEVYGFGAGIFFLGYFLLEIPGTLLVESWSARRWIARILISWGALATLMGFIHDAREFYWLRFLLGMAEAGFFPGVVVYLSHWFPPADRARAVAMFMAAIPASQIFGAPLSGLLLGADWLGLAGWRWLFIVEGLPAVALGAVTLFYLTDRPRDARWLAEDERLWIEAELAREKQAVARATDLREALRCREIWWLALALFFNLSASYGLTFWLPKMVKAASGLSNLQVSGLCILPYTVGFVMLLLVGASSDRHGERRLHAAVPLAWSGGAFLLSAAAAHGTAMTLALFSLVAAGQYAWMSAFWTLPSTLLRGRAAALATGLICCTGNLGGFVGPYVIGYLNATTQSFRSGLVYLGICALTGATLVYAFAPRKRAETIAQLRIQHGS